MCACEPSHTVDEELKHAEPRAEERGGDCQQGERIDGCLLHGPSGDCEYSEGVSEGGGGVGEGEGECVPREEHGERDGRAEEDGRADAREVGVEVGAKDWRGV